MNIFSKLFIFSLVSIIAFQAQTQPNTVTDIDGNVYPTTIIGEQEWMAENLRVSRYQNGDVLLYDQPFNVWQVSTEGIWAYYDDDANNDNIYGKLYNWHALNDERGLCPVGWRVPNSYDWQQLVEFADPDVWGNNNTLGTKLKSRRQVGSPLGSPWATNEHPRWNSHGKRFGTDDFGFGALPAGGKTAGNAYVHKGQYAYFWSTSSHSDSHAWAKVIMFSHRGMSNSAYQKRMGMSVRCIKGIEDIVYHNLSIAVNPSNAGSTTGAGNYVTGAQINITATPNEGYEFLNWTYGEDIISTQAGFTYTMPAKDVTLTANFKVASQHSNKYFSRETTANTGGNGFYALHANFGSDRIDNTFTYDFWVQPTRTINMAAESNACFGNVSVPLANSNQNWAIVPDNLGSHMGVGLTIGTNGLMIGEHANNILISRLSYPAAINDWVHVAVVYRVDSIFLYLNGDLVRSRQTPCTHNNKSVSSGLTGYMYSPDFKGYFDEFRLWDIPLTKEQIMIIKDKKLMSEVAGLRYYIDFDSGVFERTLGDLGTEYPTVNGNITPEANIKESEWELERYTGETIETLIPYGN